ncbi:hypothetical protein [Algibacter sp. Ld11]|uniref:hypothetical protein n=1 Tax=Algibacter sp. Ld11 TaxID=649150 RepID=UPI00386B3153
MLHKILLLSFFLTLFNSIEDKGLKAYYYPIEKEKTVRVYKFIEKNHPDYSEYLKITIDPETNTVLTEKYLNNLWHFNSGLEKLNKTGTELIQYTDFWRKSNGDTLTVEAKIIDKEAFRWDDKESVYEYSLNYTDPREGPLNLEKSRILHSFKTITIDNKTYKTAMFLDQYTEENSSYQSSGFYQHVYYAEGLGIVKYDTHKLKTSIEMELNEILTEEEFNKLLYKKLK